jgi:hypothetical protein
MSSSTSGRATRYDKLAKNFLIGVQSAAAMIRFETDFRSTAFRSIRRSCHGMSLNTARTRPRVLFASGRRLLG